MNKTKKRAFGKDVYLLGVKDGVYYWLEQAKWECSWYWSLGYVETYTNNKNPERARDIRSHQHFDGLFFDGLSHGFNNFKSFFDDTPFNDNEIWQIMDIMKSLYTLSDYSRMLHLKGSHYTSNPCKDIIGNKQEYERINKKIIPSLNTALYKVLYE